MVGSSIKLYAMKPETEMTPQRLYFFYYSYVFDTTYIHITPKWKWKHIAKRKLNVFAISPRDLRVVIVVDNDMTLLMFNYWSCCCYWCCYSSYHILKAGVYSCSTWFVLPGFRNFFTYSVLIFCCYALHHSMVWDNSGL